MNLNNDIVHYAIPHRCNQCTFNYGCSHVCHKTTNPQSRNFIHNNMDRFLNDTILYFKLNCAKSKTNRLKRICPSDGPYTDNVTPLDSHYVTFIHDSISQLRKGKTVYVFKLSHVWEILQFVDDVKAVYQGDGIIGLTCSNKK